MFEGLGKINEMNSVGGEVNDFANSHAVSRFPSFKPNDSEEPVELEHASETIESTPSSSSVPNSTASLTSSAEINVATSAVASTASAASASTIVVGAAVGAAVVGVVTTAITAVSIVFAAKINPDNAYIYADNDRMTIDYSIEVQYNSSGTIYVELSDELGSVALRHYELAETTPEEQADEPAYEEEERIVDADYPFVDYVWGSFGEEDASLSYDTSYSLEIYSLNGENKEPLYRKSDIVLTLNSYVNGFFWSSEPDSLSISYSYTVFYRDYMTLGNFLITPEHEYIDLENYVSLPPEVPGEPDEDGYYMFEVSGEYSSDFNFSGYTFEVRNIDTGDAIYHSEPIIETAVSSYFIEGFSWEAEPDSKMIVYTYFIRFRDSMTITNYLVNEDGEVIDLEKEINLSSETADEQDEDGYYYQQVSGEYSSDVDFEGYAFRVETVIDGERVVIFESEPEIHTAVSDFFIEGFEWNSEMDSMAIDYLYTIRYRVEMTLSNCFLTDEWEVIDIEDYVSLVPSEATASPDADGYYTEVISGTYESPVDFVGYAFTVRQIIDGEDPIPLFVSEHEISTSSSVYVDLGNLNIQYHEESLALTMSGYFEYSYDESFVDSEDFGELILSIHQSQLSSMESVDGDEFMLSMSEGKAGPYTTDYHRHFYNFSSGTDYTIDFELSKPGSEDAVIIRSESFCFEPEEVLPFIELDSYWTNSGTDLDPSSMAGDPTFETYLDFTYCMNELVDCSIYMEVYDANDSLLINKMLIDVSPDGSYTSSTVTIFDENSVNGDYAVIELSCLLQPGSANYISLGRHTIYFK